LKTLYGANQRFAARSSEGGGYEVTIEIPFRKAVVAIDEVVCGR
jgi:hypothetical protein